MVEVFKTNVRKPEQANLLVTALLKEFPFYRINFDLMDRDCILRVEGTHVQPDRVIEVMKERQYECEVLN